jgi:transcriptional regulator with XRE-family HTH domain
MSFQQVAPPNLYLFRHRLESGLSQEAQADLIGVSRKVYARAEAGGTPQPRHIARFSAYYGVSAFDLFYPEMKEAA